MTQYVQNEKKGKVNTSEKGLSAEKTRENTPNIKQFRDGVS